VRRLDEDLRVAIWGGEVFERAGHAPEADPAREQGGDRDGTLGDVP
jgi:hypothetical protein